MGIFKLQYLYKTKYLRDRQIELSEMTIVVDMNQLISKHHIRIQWIEDITVVIETLFTGELHWYFHVNPFGLNVVHLANHKHHITLLDQRSSLGFCMMMGHG